MRIIIIFYSYFREIFVCEKKIRGTGLNRRKNRGTCDMFCDFSRNFQKLSTKNTTKLFRFLRFFWNFYRNYLVVGTVIIWWRIRFGGNLNVLYQFGGQTFFEKRSSSTRSTVLAEVKRVGHKSRSKVFDRSKFWDTKNAFFE